MISSVNFSNVCFCGVKNNQKSQNASIEEIKSVEQESPKKSHHVSYDVKRVGATALAGVVLASLASCGGKKAVDSATDTTTEQVSKPSITETDKWDGVSGFAEYIASPEGTDYQQYGDPFNYVLDRLAGNLLSDSEKKEMVENIYTELCKKYLENGEFPAGTSYDVVLNAINDKMPQIENSRNAEFLEGIRDCIKDMEWQETATKIANNFAKYVTSPDGSDYRDYGSMFNHYMEYLCSPMASNKQKMYLVDTAYATMAKIKGLDVDASLDEKIDAIISAVQSKIPEVEKQGYKGDVSYAEQICDELEAMKS